MEGGDQCEGAVGVVIEVAALLTLRVVLAVLLEEDRGSGVGLVELLELDEVPFFSSEGVAFAAGEFLVVLLVNPETVLPVAVLRVMLMATLIPTVDIYEGLDKLLVPVLRGGRPEAGAAEPDPLPTGCLAIPVIVGFLIASFCSSRWVPLSRSGSAVEHTSPTTGVMGIPKP